MTPGDVIRGCFDAFSECLPPGEYSGPDALAWLIIRAAATGGLARAAGEEAAERADLMRELSALCSDEFQDTLLDMVEVELDRLDRVDDWTFRADEVVAAVCETPMPWPPFDARMAVAA